MKRPVHEEGTFYSPNEIQTSEYSSQRIHTSVQEQPHYARVKCNTHMPPSQKKSEWSNFIRDYNEKKIDYSYT